MSISAVCGECLAKEPLPEGFIEDYPEDAKRVQEWLSPFIEKGDKDE